MALGSPAASLARVLPPLTDGDVDRQDRLGHGQRPDVQAVQGFHALHGQQQIPHGCEVHTLGGPLGRQGQGLKDRAPSHPCCFLLLTRCLTQISLASRAEVAPAPQNEPRHVTLL